MDKGLIDSDSKRRSILIQKKLTNYNKVIRIKKRVVCKNYIFDYLGGCFGTLFFISFPANICYSVSIREGGKTHDIYEKNLGFPKYG